ncbi:MAG: PA2817 family protein [Motiliproteus sp.]
MNQKQQTQSVLKTLHSHIQQALKATGSDEAISIVDDRFNAIFEAMDNGEEYTYLAQDAVSNLITMHPNLTTLIPRQLLWELGGTCLHFLSDEEMDLFAQQSELH